MTLFMLLDKGNQDFVVSPQLENHLPQTQNYKKAIDILRDFDFKNQENTHLYILLSFCFFKAGGPVNQSFSKISKLLG